MNGDFNIVLVITIILFARLGVRLFNLYQKAQQEKKDEKDEKDD